MATGMPRARPSQVLKFGESLQAFRVMESASIAESNLPERFSIARILANDFFNLGMNARHQRAASRFGAELRDGLSSWLRHLSALERSVREL